jgi:hypothetical protein
MEVEITVVVAQGKVCEMEPETSSKWVRDLLPGWWKCSKFDL